MRSESIEENYDCLMKSRKKLNHHDLFLLIKKTIRQNRLRMLVNNNDPMIFDAYSIYAKDKNSLDAVNH
jgi:hypothetical protein